MSINGIDIDATIREIDELLESEKQLSPALQALIRVLITLVGLMANRLSLNSKNSSKPPSSDQWRKKENRSKSNNKPGGQRGHQGSTLKPVPDPDEVKFIELDRSTLPPGKYRRVGVESRQVVDIDITTFITEYQAEVLEDDTGRRFTAEFPQGITRPVQYGTRLKAQAVYLSQFQLIPYQRIQDYFADQLKIPLSTGSLYNFNQEAYGALNRFEDFVKERLSVSELVHADETGINVDGKTLWLHCASNALYTHYCPHLKRGRDAIDEIGVLPNFKGILCHDHWKPYYTLDCTHALCNAHHLRELTRAFEQDEEQWAKVMHEFLLNAKAAVDDAGGVLNQVQAKSYRKRYKEILESAQIECPAPDPIRQNGKRGRIKRSKARNLLERLIEYEDDVLRFMVSEIVPFTNNQGENDLRMTKVQQKISGCFRSIEGAKIFCRVRGYLSTCRKHNVSATEALDLLFKGKLPEFVVG
jgi:transposase